MENRNIEFLENAVDSLNAQLKDYNHKVVLNYEVEEYEDDEDCESDDMRIIESAILILLNEDGITEIETEKDDFVSLKECNAFVVQFINDIKEYVKTIALDKSTLYNFYETDAWQTHSSRSYLGTFNNKLLALIELQCHFKEVFDEVAYDYTNLNNVFEQNSSGFDIVVCDEVELNTVM